MDADRFDSHHLLDTGPTSAMLDIAKNCSVYSYPNIHPNISSPQFTVPVLHPISPTYSPSTQNTWSFGYYKYFWNI